MVGASVTPIAEVIGAAAEIRTTESNLEALRKQREADKGAGQG